MKLLYRYTRSYKKLLLIALLLAATGQVFSMLDPYIFSKVVDGYANSESSYTFNQYMRGVGVLLLLAVGVAMVSRVARTFESYYVNVIVQKVGAALYQDGIKHALSLPYAAFEDSSSGHTLGVLEKVRSDVEKLIRSFINILFPSLVGIVFVSIYAFSIHWSVAPIYFSAVPVIGFISSYLSKRIKKVQKFIVNKTTTLAGSTTESLRNIELVKSLGLAGQEEKRLNKTTDEILNLELKESSLYSQPQLYTRHYSKCYPNKHSLHNAFSSFSEGSLQ